MERSSSSTKEGEWVMAVIKRIASKATPKKIVSYLTQEEKTEEKLIGGKDCDPDNIVNDFNMTQELYGKTGGVKYHHIIQSFSPEDNITPEKAHEIGKELAESQFKGFEVFVVTHKDKDHIHNHLVVNSVSFENGLKYNASNKSLWDIKRESNRLCERENLKTLDLYHKAEKRISSAEKRIMDRGQIPWKDELRQIIDIARERTKDLQSFREFLEKNFEIETRVTKNSISYKHPDHGKAIRGRSLGDKYNKEELENEFNGQEKSIFRDGERGTNFGYEGISDLDKEFERRADSLEQQINQDHRLNRERERAIQEQRENKRREEQGTKRENTRSLQDDDKEIRGTERASSREVRKDFEGSRKYQEISHGNDESIKSNGSSSRENRQTELEGQSKTICNSNGNNARSNIDNSRSIPVNKPNKVRDWDMER
ncbi:MULTISPECIES: relaxase/mobilization nuclease domain-containing protein [Clostridium]|jgi:hypothetical protein|uniref:Mobilisation protein n=6 Tax=Clostridia TaxID=186801 RepID=A0A174IKN4_9CLOT|nr:relaxase/mobilization nuclease domain-containing protein [Clostridium sp.]CUO87883.1 mobilisation protein [Clostridium disporicum]